MATNPKLSPKQKLTLMALGGALVLVLIGRAVFGGAKPAEASAKDMKAAAPAPVSASTSPKLATPSNPTPAHAPKPVASAPATLNTPGVPATTQNPTRASINHSNEPDSNNSDQEATSAHRLTSVMPGKAAVINGKLLRVGQTNAAGVTLLEANQKSAVIEVDGWKVQLDLERPTPGKARTTTRE